MSHTLKKNNVVDRFIEIMITKPTIIVLSIGVGAAFIFLG